MEHFSNELFLTLRMSRLKKNTGDAGEESAVIFLKKKGYRIVERNFRTRNGEIDIIAIDHSEKEKTLVFIEVKTRQSNEYGSAVESITYYKLQAMRRTAMFYQQTHRNLPELLRLDLVAIDTKENGQIASIELIKNIG